MKHSRFALALAVSAAAITAPAQAQVQITGSTTGCFYQGTLGGQCATGTGTATVGNLTFTGRSFDVTVGPNGLNFFSGNANDSFGLFSMSNANFNFNPPGSNNTYGFRLFVSIISPITTPAGVNLIGTLDGELNINSSGDDLEIDFSNSYTTFTYEGGSFDMRAYEFDEISKNQSKYVGFKVECGGDRYWDWRKQQWVTVPGTCGTPTTTEVAEPSSVLLTAAGLAGMVGVVSRRRRRQG